MRKVHRPAPRASDAQLGVQADRLRPPLNYALELINMKKRKIFAFLFLAFAMTTGYAQVYKCIVNGRTIFSDAPCQAGSTGVLIQEKKDPNKSTKSACRHLRRRTGNYNSKPYAASNNLTNNSHDRSQCKVSPLRRAFVMTSPYQSKRDVAIWKRIRSLIKTVVREQSV